MNESRLIPDPMHAEITVQVQMPPEAVALMRDLHEDRQAIGLGGAILLTCVVLMTWRFVFGRQRRG